MRSLAKGASFHTSPNKLCTSYKTRTRSDTVVRAQRGPTATQDEIEDPFIDFSAAPRLSQSFQLFTPSPENTKPKVGGFLFSNLQRLQGAKPIATQLQSLAEVAQHDAAAAEAATRQVKQIESVATSTLNELKAIEAELAKQDEVALEARLGKPLSVPLLVLPPWMVSQPPPVIPSPLTQPAPKPPPPAPTLPVDETKPYGSGQEILLQGFNWESHKHSWYQVLHDQAEWIASMGVTLVWMPPPTDSVSPEGYMPRDLYNLNSAYGSMDELRRAIRKLQQHGIKCLADVVLNHRCASHQSPDGTWNLFGGKLNWDNRAICSDDPHFKGKGSKKSGELWHAAPNVDHTQDFVASDLREWLRWLMEDVGYNGFRMDYVRGYSGKHIKDYMSHTTPWFAVGEFWDSMAYDHSGRLLPNQNAHRQRIVDWINAAGGLSTAFDMTTKGILHAVFEHGEFWRLRDDKGKPPGVVGWWPTRSVTFLENHDTGSTQGHWRFPDNALEPGYAYILTHPGTPTVFYDHLHDPNLQRVLTRLISIRKRAGVHVGSTCKIVAAEKDVYAAEIHERLLVKIGPGSYDPADSHWKRIDKGHQWAVWERTNM